jgi:hypothetical protein
LQSEIGRQPFPAPAAFPFERFAPRAQRPARAAVMGGGSNADKFHKVLSELP